MFWVVTEKLPASLTEFWFMIPTIVNVTTEPPGKLLPETMPVTFRVFPGRIVANDLVPFGQTVFRYYA